MSNTKVSICIAGKNAIGVNALEYLIDNFPKCKLYALPNDDDQGYDTWQPSLRKKAIEKSIQIISLDQAYKIPGLVFISLEFNRLIKPSLFNTSKLFNIHFSLLPAYKGMYTSAMPLLNGEDKSGVTLHKIDKGIDTGEIIDQLSFPLNIATTAEKLYKLYLKYSYELFKKNIENLILNKFTIINQPAINSTYYSKSTINYSSLTIDLNSTAHQISNQIRAYYFPVYQVPTVLGDRIAYTEIKATKSKLRPGCSLERDSKSHIISSIDYDLCLYRDKTAELMDAAATNNGLLAEECLKSGANKNWRDKNGWSPLIIAAFNGSVDVLEVLIEKNCDLNLGNYRSTTPLMYAMSYFEKHKDAKPFTMLLSAGANTSLKDIAGKNIKDYMIERGVKTLNKFL